MGGKLPDDTFGGRLRAARKRKRLSGTQVAHYVGDRSHQSVVNWESGANFPELEKLILIAGLLDVTLDWLVWGDDMASGIEARLRKIPKVLRDGLIQQLHREIDETEKLAARLPPELTKGEHVGDRDARLRAWSAKNKKVGAVVKPRKKAREGAQ